MKTAAKLWEKIEIVLLSLVKSHRKKTYTVAIVLAFQSIFILKTNYGEAKWRAEVRTVHQVVICSLSLRFSCH